jgi:protein-S-isoprenylcysteine O-methyltransferase Ste14
MSQSMCVPLERADSPQVKLPPPLVYALPLIAGIVLSRWVPLVNLPEGPWRMAGAILALLGLLFGGWARLIFLQRKTTVLPTRPASTLVADGPFRISRHPMYVGFTAIYIGLAIMFRSIWPLLFLPLVLVVVQKTAIDREEAYLERRFGREYRDYKQRVRQWL